MYPPRFYNGRTGPCRPKLKRREYVYIMEENTNSKPAGKMDVILATDVEGLMHCFISIIIYLTDLTLSVSPSERWISV